MKKHLTTSLLALLVFSIVFGFTFRGAIRSEWVEMENTGGAPINYWFTNCHYKYLHGAYTTTLAISGPVDSCPDAIRLDPVTGDWEAVKMPSKRWENTFFGWLFLPDN